MTRGPGSPASHIIRRTSMGSLGKRAKVAPVSFSILVLGLALDNATGLRSDTFAPSETLRDVTDVSFASACIRGKSVVK